MERVKTSNNLDSYSRVKYFNFEEYYSSYLKRVIMSNNLGSYLGAKDGLSSFVIFEGRSGVVFSMSWLGLLDVSLTVACICGCKSLYLGWHYMTYSFNCIGWHIEVRSSCCSLSWCRSSWVDVDIVFSWPIHFFA